MTPRRWITAILLGEIFGSLGVEESTTIDSSNLGPEDLSLAKDAATRAMAQRRAKQRPNPASIQRQPEDFWGIRGGGWMNGGLVASEDC